MSEIKPSLGVTEITNEDGINDFLGIDKPKFDLTSKENTAVPEKGKTVTIDEKELAIDENELFGILPEEKLKKIEATDEKEKGQEDEGLLETAKETPPQIDVDENTIFSQLGEGLSKLGVLSLPEDSKDFQWNQESFIERLEAAKLEGAENIVQDYLQAVENGEELFKALFIDKVPIESFANYTKSIIDYSSIDVSENAGDNREKNQTRVVRDYLKTLGQEDEEINSQIEYLKDTDKIGAFSEKYKAKLVERSIKERENAVLQAKTLEQQKIKEKETFLSSMATELRAAVKNKELDGFPISEKEANELFVYSTKPVWKIPSTGQELSDFDKALMELRKDPKAFIKLAKLVKNGLDIKDAVKTQSTKENNKIFNNLKQAAKVSGAKDEDPFLKLFGK